jgi:hypothetical protein
MPGFAFLASSPQIAVSVLTTELALMGAYYGAYKGMHFGEVYSEKLAKAIVRDDTGVGGLGIFLILNFGGMFCCVLMGGIVGFVAPVLLAHYTMSGEQ